MLTISMNVFRLKPRYFILIVTKRLSSLIGYHQRPKENEEGDCPAFPGSLSLFLKQPFKARRASPSESRKPSILTPGCMCPGLSKSKSELGRSIHPSFPVSAIDPHEISGLTRIFHTDSLRGAANPDGDTTGGRETAVETAFRQP